MKSGLLKVLLLTAPIMLAGCQTATGANYSPSEVEKRFYKECAANPVEPPCGHY